jgi:putative two-component system response regulator
MCSCRMLLLDDLVQLGAAGNAPEVKTALLRLRAELRARLARGSSQSYQFFWNAVNTLAKLKGSANAEARFDCLYDCGQYFFVSGYCAEALATARHLKNVAVAAQSKSLERKAFGFAGIVSNDVGDLCEAVSNFSSAIALARSIPDIDGENRTLINLGVALIDASLYREAIPCFKRVLEHPSGSDQTRSIRASALANLAKIHFHLEDFKLALPLIKESIDSDAAPSDAPSALKRTFREYTYVQVALELGELNLARKRASECARYGQFSDTPRSKCLSDLTSGLCEIYGGNVDRGVHQLEAIAFRKDIAASFIVDILPALVKAYDAAGKTQEALQCMEQLLSHVRSMREKGINALVGAHQNEEVRGLDPTEGPGLRSLQLLEARLRVKVAQREAIEWQVEMFERLAATADLKEEASGEHAYRVASLSRLLAMALGWMTDACQSIELAARLHDIGKTAMPDRILLSTNQLRDAERRFITSHTTVGAELLGNSQLPQLRMAEQIARHHHEWWNGEGYPSKLKGKRIPIHARIVALADVFDALTHGRPFSEPWPIDKAIEEIRARKGTQFDPEMTDVFLELIAKLRTEHEDLDEYLGRAGRNSPFLQARNKIRLMLAEERENEKMATVTGNQTRH